MNKLYTSLKTSLALISFIAWATLAGAETVSNAEFGFSAIFPSAPQKASGAIAGLYGVVTETCFIATTGNNTCYIVTIHDYRRYPTQPDSKAKIIEFTVKHSVLKKPENYKKVSKLNITAPNTAFGKMAGADHSKRRYYLGTDTGMNREFVEVRTAVPYDGGVLYSTSLLTFENDLLFWVQAICNDAKRSIGPDQALFLKTFEIK